MECVTFKNYFVIPLISAETNKIAIRIM